MTTIYELCYSQNGGTPEAGPAIASLWRRPDPSHVPSDCVVVEREVSDAEAEAICE